jgi:hypothetical protein
VAFQVSGLARIDQCKSDWQRNRLLVSGPASAPFLEAVRGGKRQDVAFDIGAPGKVQFRRHTRVARFAPISLPARIKLDFYSSAHFRRGLPRIVNDKSDVAAGRFGPIGTGGMARRRKRERSGKK